MIWGLFGFEILVFLLIYFLEVSFFPFILIVFENFVTDLKLKFESQIVCLFAKEIYSIKGHLESLFAFLGFL